jgi:hypothetical protein
MTALQLSVLAIQLVLALVLLRVIREYRHVTADESGLFARVRTLEQNGPPDPLLWGTAWHLRSPVPEYGRHRPQHLKEESPDVAHLVVQGQ